MKINPDVLKTRIPNSHISIDRSQEKFEPCSSPLRQTDRKDLKYDNIAFGIKTGKDVIMDRVPSMFDTFLKDIKNVALFGDSHGLCVNNQKIIDAWTDYRPNRHKRLNKRTEKVEHVENEGWVIFAN